MVSELGKELLLAQEAILVKVSLLDELQNIIIADVDIEILVENRLDLVDADQSLLFSVKEGEHIQSLLFSTSTKEPFFCDEVYNFTKGKSLLLLMYVGNLIFDFLSIHLGVGEVAQDTPKVLPIYISCVTRVIEGECVLDFVFLSKRISTISSESLLLRLVDLVALALLTFFLNPGFISYNFINRVS